MLTAPARARRSTTAPLLGSAVGAVLVLAAVAVPPLTGWRVRPLLVGGVAPLAANWDPRVGPGTPFALVIAAVALRQAADVARRASFGRLLVLAYLAGVGWLTALATVDGWAGLSGVLERPGEYLPAARSIGDVGQSLHHFIGRIPLHSAHNWPTHIAGHPPGALLFFVALVRLGLGASLAAGVVVVLIAASTPLAVLVTLRRLGAEPAARRAAPFLVFGPAAIWTAVSADAVFAAVAAWGLAALSVGATSGGRRRAGWSLLAGLLLGCCAFLSYGLPLLAIVAVGVLFAARSARPLVWAAVGAALVVVTFAAAGFAWWDALPVLRTRYYAGIAAVRPAAYWVWGDVAALVISAGPIAAPAVAHALTRLRDRSAEARAVLSVSLSSLVAVALADASLMSKAEVERIWLPFVPWLLVATALLPPRWRRSGLIVQVGLALVVQTLLRPRW